MKRAPALLFAVLVGAACQQSASCPAPIRSGACHEDDLECSPGTYCQPTDGGSSCAVATNQVPSTTLASGFGVPTFRLATAAGDLSVFQWTNERSFVRVRCAIFTCRPSNACVDANGDAGVDSPTPSIPAASAERCILATADATPPESEVQISAFKFTGLSSTLPSMLSIGCWAYDDVALVRATQLVDFDEELLGVHDFVRDCERSPVGSTCALRQPTDSGQRFGTCGAGAGASATCRERCVGADACKCTAPDGGKLATGALGVCEAGP